MFSRPAAMQHSRCLNSTCLHSSRAGHVLLSTRSSAVSRHSRRSNISLQTRVADVDQSDRQEQDTTVPAAEACAPAQAAGPASPVDILTAQLHGSSSAAAEACWSAWSTAVALIQHGLVLAAASSLVLSMCLSVPAASATMMQQQPGSVHMVLLQSAAPTGGALVFQQQQQQQQQQPTGWQFELPFSTSSSNSSSTSQQQQQFELGSQMEDSLLEGMRQFEAGVDRAYGAFTNSVHLIDAAQASSEQAAMDAQAQALIREVWEVVDTNYLDARRSGFDHDKWGCLRDEALARNYYDQRSIHRAVRDMLAQGVSDPYCRFIEPAEFSNMKKYDVTGVGLNLGTAEEYIKKTGRPLPRPVSGDGVDAGVWVVGMSKESEADRAGIQQGDQLLQVAALSLDGVTPFQAASLIAGPDEVSESTPVGLVIKKADGQVVDITVQRPARYLATPVSSSLQQRYSGERVGVIRLTSFNARALRDVSTALDKLQQQGATELVLDLRDNRGGLVSEGLEVARLFLSDQVPIVLTQSKAMAADPPKALTTAATRLPLTVLVNEHTASAGEILAGAIKDNCRGVLVGKKTYGKGLIQSVYELSDSSGLIITVGKYLTPRGVDIDRFGIAPNFTTLPDPNAAEETLNACKLEAAAVSEQQQQQKQLQLASATTSEAG